jgi:Protein kinase domain
VNDDVLAPGALIGSYQVIDRLGAGGMGEVYRARDTRLGRLVAIKVLRRGADPELLHRLQREARAASALNHPNIVHIYDVGEAGDTGAYYVVMEHVEGESLRRRMAPGPLPIAEALDFGAQLADGLANAHRAGVVHRDLKPENVMVTPSGLLKILDFGLAKRVVAPLEGIDSRETLSRYGTRAGMLLGTLEYMSPEQASGRSVDHRTDQFSLGAILYEMLAGRRPFQRETPAQVLAAVIERDPEPVERLRPNLPDPLASLVARCLQKDPERRFARTDELASQLAAASGHGRSGAAPLESAVVSHGASSALPVDRVQPRAPAVRALYHVETRRGVRVYDEAELVHLIRRDKLKGMELVRRDDEETWQPLFESHVYRREIPTIGDPRDAARRRMLRGVAGHFTGFFITSVVMFATQGHFPFWLAIWGAVLAVQTLGAAPAAWTLFRRRRIAAGASPGQLAPPAEPSASSALAQEAARVRSLIEQRGGPEASRLMVEVDGILERTARLTSRQADLEEQTSPRERETLERARADAQARLERAELEQDRRLFERQVDVLKGREEAIAKALRVLERLRVRREVVEHQLKQLRLDLSRDAASGLDVPELSSRLEFIRFEVDAKEEVEELGAARG